MHLHILLKGQCKFASHHFNYVVSNIFILHFATNIISTFYVSHNTNKLQFQHCISINWNKNKIKKLKSNFLLQNFWKARCFVWKKVYKSHPLISFLLLLLLLQFSLLILFFFSKKNPITISILSMFCYLEDQFLSMLHE